MHQMLLPTPVWSLERMYTLPFSLEASHDLVVKTADKLNAYVMTSNREMDSTFWDDAGKSAIIVRGVYVLKRMGALFKVHLTQCMQELGYESCDANLDLWMKPEFRPEHKLDY